MNVAPRLTGFAAALAALFGAGALAGGLLDADAPGGDREARAHGGDMAAGDMAMAVRGLGVAENGLRLVVADPAFRRGTTDRLRFRIVDERGRAVRDFDVEHTKRMHLIVARRDLTGFQHLHPVMAADGTWSTPLRLSDAGSYRVFADFSHDDRPTTLASDLRVAGAAALRALPAPATTARTEDGDYAVRLAHGTPRAGEQAALRFTITTRGGAPVVTQPYLGAGGHLVALREGDLAFLHVHPTGEGVGFEATFPTAGAYRLFLQFKAAGTVHTVAFTLEVTS